jgi:hypothetical protein
LNLGQISKSYALNSVIGDNAVGGLAGLNGDTVANSYWDENSTNKGATGIGNDVSNTGATGLTSMGSSSTAFSILSYSGLGAAGAVADGVSNAVGITDGASNLAWYLLDGQTRPFLSWEAPINNPVSKGAHLVYTAHQLQLMAINLSAEYVLGKNVDLSETRQLSSLWNSAGGFVSIGTYTDPFSGSFNGGSFNISNLYINTPQASYVGLFGISSGSLTSISLGGTVIGLDNVGLLAGLNLGSIRGASASGWYATVTLYAQSSSENLTPQFVLNAALTGDGVNRVYIIETDGNFVNNVGTDAFQTPNGSWLVYSQNQEGSDQSVEDNTGGLYQYHLYGTNFMDTPAYLLAPGLNYQIYSFTPTLTLTAVANGADSSIGSVTVQYGAATPGLTYIVNGLLPGDTVTAGETFNQVLSNQPGEQTT